MKLPTFSRQSDHPNADDRPTAVDGAALPPPAVPVSRRDDTTAAVPVQDRAEPTTLSMPPVPAERSATTATEQRVEAERAERAEESARSERVAAERAAAEAKADRIKADHDARPAHDSADHDTRIDHDTRNDQGTKADHDTKADRDASVPPVPVADRQPDPAPAVAGPKPRASLLATLGLITGVASALLVLSGPLVGYGIGLAALAVILSFGGISATGRRHVAGKTDALIGLVLGLGAIVVGILALTGSLSWLGTDVQPVNNLREWLDTRFANLF